MFTRKQMKDAAKLNFKNNWLSSIIATLLILLPSLIISIPAVMLNFTEEMHLSQTQQALLLVPSMLMYIAAIFVVPVLQIGYNRYFMKSRGGLNPKPTEPFSPYKEGNWGNIIFVTIVTEFSIFFWSMLFFIPGIIKAFQYSLVPVILASNPTVSPRRAKQLSRMLMRHHCWDLFVLYLSFIGWGFLSTLTGGVLQIVYVQPYFQATIIEFYSCRRAELINRGELSVLELPSFGADWYSPINPSGPFDNSPHI